VESASSPSIVVHLDEEAQRDLRHFEATGLSRSEAIRLGLRVAVKRRRRRDAIRAEAAQLAEHQDDQREMLEVTALMTSVRGED
jgi:hypothetical protein